MLASKMPCSPDAPDHPSQQSVSLVGGVCAGFEDILLALQPSLMWINLMVKVRATFDAEAERL